MAVIAATGGGFAFLTRRPRRAPNEVREVWPWSDVARWTVRFPRGVDLRPADWHDQSAEDDEQILGRLPAREQMTWTGAGVHTALPPREIIMAFRHLITEDLSAGRVRLARGWVVAETEWILLQLADGLGRSTPHAT